MKAKHRDKHDVYTVPGLNRGLRVLEVVAENDRPLNITEIAKCIGVPRSSAFRYVYTLKDMGFLEAVQNSNTYALGPRVLNIGFAFLNSQDIVTVAHAQLEALRDSTKVSTHLAIRDGRDVLYLDCVQTKSDFVSNINIGARRPCYALPLGWLLLSALDPDDIRGLYEGVEMEPRTAKTPTTIDALLETVSDANRQGHVISKGFSESGGSSVNAPVFDRDGHIVAAIDVSGPDGAFDIAQLEDFYLEEVLDAAKRISERLGYSA